MNDRRQLSLFQLYALLLERRPLLTKSLTCATTNGLGNLLVQQIHGRWSGRVHWRKVLKYAMYGLLIGAPLDHVLYSVLRALVAASRASPAVQSLLTLTVANAVVVPLQNVAYLATLYAITVDDAPDGRLRFQELLRFVRRKFLSVQVPCWVLFPPLQIFAFRYLAPHQQGPFFYFLGFIFNVAVALRTKVD